jgi:hypothetical protein
MDSFVGKPRSSSLGPQSFITHISPSSTTIPLSRRANKMSDTDSDSSALSSPPPSDEEIVDEPVLQKPTAKKSKKRKVHEAVDSDSPAETAPRKKREPSPPHEFVLADNPDVAVSEWRVKHVGFDVTAASSYSHMASEQNR